MIAEFYGGRKFTETRLAAIAGSLGTFRVEIPQEGFTPINYPGG